MAISIGNKIELVLLDDIIKNEKNKKVLVSKLYDIQPKDVLQIAMPIFEGRIIPLEIGTKYSACFYTDKGLLQCNVLIQSRYKDGNILYMDVQMLGMPQKVQRRQFYRYQCLLDSKIRIVSDEEFTTGIPDNTDVPEWELDWSNSRILDISGGGARIAYTHAVDRNEVIKIRFTVMILDHPVSFNLFARVLASKPMQGRRDVVEIRLEFMKIAQEERDKIIRFIFESERVARAKETGNI